MKHDMALPLAPATGHTLPLSPLAWGLAVIGLVAPLLEGDARVGFFVVGLIGWGAAGALTFFRGRVLTGWLLWSICYGGGYVLSTNWQSRVGLQVNATTNSSNLTTILFIWALTVLGAVLLSGMLQPARRSAWLQWGMVALAWSVAVGLGGYLGMTIGYLAGALLPVGLVGNLSFVAGLMLGGVAAHWLGRRVQSFLLTA